MENYKDNSGVSIIAKLKFVYKYDHKSFRYGRPDTCTKYGMVMERYISCTTDVTCIHDIALWGLECERELWLDSWVKLINFSVETWVVTVREVGD